MLVQVNQLGADNAGDFPSGVAAAQFAVVVTAVGEVESKSALPLGSFADAAQQLEVKDAARENLRDEMSDISRIAKSMEYEFARFADKFRFQVSCLKGTNEIASGVPRRTRFTTLSVPARDEWIGGRYSSFTGTGTLPRSDRRVPPDAIEYVPFRDRHVAATAGTSAKIREGMIAKRILDGVVHNEYAADPGKLAARLSASHTEKAPKKKAPTP